MEREFRRAVKYGCGTASNYGLAKSLVQAALDTERVPSHDIAAMMSEASCRIDAGGWRDGIHELGITIS